MTGNRLIASCTAVLTGALIVVGAVSDGIVRHVLQTAPGWIVIVLGLRNSVLTRWAALPVFLVWLLIFVLIWLYLLDLSDIIDGHFGPAEIAMTIVGAIACATGLFAALRTGGSAKWWSGMLIFLLMAALQIGVVALSMKPAIASDTGFRNWLKHAQTG
ncbi:MAG TPA: hypothetical protein VMH86_01310 [Rhizomicrobium sp.]|nr:hypothetical protein [Rhizomicrobium sp.]